jgi:uncharacterized membrane protein (DUF106 family)
MFLNDFATNMPLLSIIAFSALIALITTFLYKILTKQEDLKKLKEKTKALQNEIKQEKDQNKLMGLQREMLALSAEQMKHSLKPMLITSVPILFVFAGLRSLYSKVGDIIPFGTDLPIVHTGAGWFLSYIIFTLIFSAVFRKLLKVN